MNYVINNDYVSFYFFPIIFHLSMVFLFFLLKAYGDLFRGYLIACRGNDKRNSLVADQTMHLV